MRKMPRLLAVILARGGSKGLPGKNRRLLHGIPLVAWPIQAALNSRYVDRVIVSTDDAAVAKIALEYGADVPFMRPPELATDTALSSDAVIHAINACTEQGEVYDYVLLLEPTSPLTDAADIDRAFESLIKGEGLAIVGACKAETCHPVYAATLGEDGFLKPYQRDSFAEPMHRQAIDDVYFFEGSLYISEIKQYIKTKTFYHGSTLPYFVPAWKALEIDSLFDFLMVETVMQQKELLV